MATVSAAFDIQAGPAKILAVLADLDQYPRWSAVHKRATILQRYPDGRPKRASMAVAAMGMTDEQTLDYVWSDGGVDWSLVKASQQRDQHGSYTIVAGDDGGSHLRYSLSIDPAIPLPGLVVRQVMKKAVSAATEGLKQHVEALP